MWGLSCLGSQSSWRLSGMHTSANPLTARTRWCQHGAESSAVLKGEMCASTHVNKQENNAQHCWCKSICIRASQASSSPDNYRSPRLNLRLISPMEQTKKKKKGIFSGDPPNLNQCLWNLFLSWFGCFPATWRGHPDCCQKGFVLFI